VLAEEEKQYAYFQQIAQQLHTLQQSVEALNEIFGERIISQGLWLPHLLDLSVQFLCTGKLEARNILKALEN
jgi:hypothetical protein